MCELFAMSAKYPTQVQLSLATFAEHGGHSGPHKDGWGIGYYQHNDAWLVKAPESAADSATQALVRASAPASRLVISHIRLATQGAVGLSNTQPFSYPLAGKRILFAHNGHVPAVLAMRHPLAYQSLGDTDSEHVFAQLLTILEKVDALCDAEKFTKIERFLNTLAELGPLNLLFSDSEHLYAYSNKRTQKNGQVSAPGMHFLCRQCNAEQERALSGVEIQGDQQNLILFASVPLSDEHWQPMTPNVLYVAKQGMLIR